MPASRCAKNSRACEVSGSAGCASSSGSPPRRGRWISSRSVPGRASTRRRTAWSDATCGADVGLTHIDNAAAPPRGRRVVSRLEIPLPSRSAGSQPRTCRDSRYCRNRRPRRRTRSASRPGTGLPDQGQVSLMQSAMSSEGIVLPANPAPRAQYRTAPPDFAPPFTKGTRDDAPPCLTRPIRARTGDRARNETRSGKEIPGVGVAGGAPIGLPCRALIEENDHAASAHDAPGG